jgi:hypothetical protein
MRCPEGFYFSQGCFELISRLENKIESYPNARLVQQTLDSVFIDSVRQCIELSVGESRYTASKLVVTRQSSFRVSNPQFTNQNFSTRDYYHLYILVSDPSPSRFTYKNGIVAGMNRSMNLTPFVQFPQEGLQLIAIQVNSKNELSEGMKFLDAFKSNGLLASDAQILHSDTYIFQQSSMNISALQKLAGSLVQVLETSSFASMSPLIDKWKKVLTPQ